MGFGCLAAQKRNQKPTVFCWCYSSRFICPTQTPLTSHQFSLLLKRAKCHYTNSGVGLLGLYFFPCIYIKNKRGLIHRPKPLGPFLSLRLRWGWSERFRKAGGAISGFWCWECVPGMARPDGLGSSQKTQAGLRDDNGNLPGKRKRKEKRTKKEDI